MKRLLIALLVSLAIGIELTAKCPCKVTKITNDMIPYTIIHSGRYEVCEDLTYDGSTPSAAIAAIVIAADNVQIFLNNHSITATGFAQAAIFGNGKSELVIANDAISNSAHAGIGIWLVSYQKVILKNLLITNSDTGLLLDTCTDVFVDTCSCINNSSNGADLKGSSSVTFENAVFKGNATGLRLDVNSADCKILTSSFENSTSQNLLAKRVDGLLVKNTTFSIDTTTLAMIQLGDGMLNVANKTRFEGCTFIGTTSFTDLIAFVKGSGLIIDSCLFDAQNASAANLLNLETGTKDIYVNGSTFNGNGNVNNAGINAAADNVFIEESLVQGLISHVSGIKAGGTGCTIRGCTINNNTIGITLEGSSGEVLDSIISKSITMGIDITSSFNVVARNTVTQNSSSMAYSSIEVTGSSNSIVGNIVSGGGADGIRLEASPSAETNTVQYNIVHSNGGFGINDATATTTTTTNQIYYNTAYNNGTNGLQNYNVSGITVVLPQGNCTKETANIDGGLTPVSPISCP